jgi:hypothetical protein
MLKSLMKETQYFGLFTRGSAGPQASMCTSSSGADAAYEEGIKKANEIFLVDMHYKSRKGKS